jgi:hypothetical protein
MLPSHFSWCSKCPFKKIKYAFLVCTIVPNRWTNSMEKYLCEVNNQVIKKVSIGCGIWRFITLFTRTCHWTLSYTAWIEVTSSWPFHPPIYISYRSPKWSHPFKFFLTEIIFSIHVLLPAEVIFFTWNTLLFFSGDNYKISSLCCNLHPSDLVGQNMHLLAYVNVLNSFLKNHVS